jgi:hypothetical protein
MGFVARPGDWANLGPGFRDELRELAPQASSLRLAGGKLLQVLAHARDARIRSGHTAK